MEKIKSQELLTSDSPPTNPLKYKGSFFMPERILVFFVEYAYIVL